MQDVGKRWGGTLRGYAIAAQSSGLPDGFCIYNIPLL